MSKPLPKDSEAPVLEVVTPVGTSPWIITRSKSHQGRIYYFNTLTGEAVWNLSSTDIEKAKNTTKMLNNLPGTNFENYPEPKEPPTNVNIHSFNKHQAIKCYTPSTVFNKQIINNQFPRQIDTAPYGGTQFLGCTSFHSPNVWAVPPNHQILIAPTQSPIVNQLQTSVKIAYGDMDQLLAKDTSLPHSTQVKTNQFNRFDNRKTWYGGNNLNNSGFHHKKFFHKRANTSFHDNNRSFNMSNQDLREKLSSRRQFKMNRSEEHLSQGNTSSLANLQPEQSNMQTIKIITPRIEELYPTDVDDTWLKKYAFIKGTQLMLNVHPLRDIVLTKQDLSCWYIVIDSTALLNHFNLINIIVNSDEKCQLMISHYVLTEVRTASRSNDLNLMNRAIIVLQMLTQQFAAHRAVLGLDSKEDCKSILDFSVKLSEQNNNVVLISEDITSKISGVKSILIFTIEEIKKILVSRHEDTSIKNHKHSTEPLTVTIRNDNITEQDIAVSNANSDEKEKSNDQREADNEPDHIEALVHPKNTLEMGVQTDYTEEYFANSNTHNKSTLQENVTVSNPTEGPKRRLIRTCRMNVNNEKNLEKRQFVWHRRKSNSTPQTVHQKHESKNDNEHASASNDNAKAYETVSDCDKSTSVTENMTNDTRSQEGYECQNYEDCSETTESSISIQRRSNKNLVIEESSTSGIISNTVSNVDSESDHSIIPAIISNDFSHEESESDHSIMPVIEINMANYDSMDKCVMFEIESPAMEESLKMKSDEWVSRFVQIMEEVLTEILKLDPPFHSDILPPPWTLHEAAECIKKKFSNDSDIIDSAGKLTNMLYKISDRRGKIKLRLEPSEFMEMYSYGVYLVDSLQSNLNDYEDIQTAQESLARLLSDIQDPNPHNTHNDTFSDNYNDTLSAIITPSSNTDAVAKETNNFSLNNSYEEEQHIQNNQSLDERSSNSNRYNLRSAEKRQDEINEEQSVKFIRSIDKESNFFFTLNLKRKPIECNNPELTENDRDRKTDRVETEKENSLESKDIPGPIIIRNFSKCAEFEERLRRKVNENLEMDTLDYTEDDLEYDYYEPDYNSDYDYQSNEENQEENDVEVEGSDENHLTDSLDINEHQINGFKWIAGRIMSEVRETLLQVNFFCNETRKELDMPETLRSSRGQEIQEQAKEAHKQMCNLQTSLNNILNREEKCFDDTDNMQKLLQHVGVLFESEDCENYRLKISKCLEQVSVLLDAVKMVMEATEA